MQKYDSKNGRFSPKMQRFIQEYCIDCNGSQAAIRAGYSKKTAESQGWRLLGKLGVKEEIQRRIDEKAKQSAITAEYVLSSLNEVAQRCLQKVPVMVKKNGEMVQKKDEKGNGVWHFDSAGANKALELLGKNLKLFTERFDHTSNGQTLASMLLSKEESPVKQIQEDAEDDNEE